jgi:tRNA threonylcarbamoyl adenosine modification protein (Sua5/YciO/YrdC/YwlC family)
MAPPRVELDSVGAVELAAQTVQGGGVVLLPTDTVYGLAVLPGSLEKLFAVKGRPDEVPIALLVAGADQVEELAVVDDRARELMSRHWPGALTLVLPKRDDVTLALGGEHPTVGVRCPDDPFLRELASRVGPLATTSANRHGLATPPTASDASAQLGSAVDLVVDGGPRTGSASTVVDATGDELHVLRQGSVTLGRGSQST